MDIALTPGGDQPIYRQIADQLSAQILNGTLPPGTPLPPIRTVARELEVSVITVKKAWEELEREGFVDAIVGKGSFVSSRAAGDLAGKRTAVAAERLREDVAFCRQMGLTKDELVELVVRAFDQPEGR